MCVNHSLACVLTIGVSSANSVRVEELRPLTRSKRKSGDAAWYRHHTLIGANHD